MRDQPASPSLSIIFFGTSSQYSLNPLIQMAGAGEHHLVGIVESGPRGCKQKHLSNFQKILELLSILWGKPSLWVASLRLKVPYFYLCHENEKDLVAFINKINPDVGCVASFNQLLPIEIIKIPRFGIINFHPTLLPKYRGPNAWFWMYHEMETEGGATIHFIDEGEDTGDILKQASFPIPLGMEPHLLRRITIDLGTRLFSESLRDIANSNAHPVPQVPLPGLLRARRLKKNEDLFDWRTWSLQQTYHFLRGTLPFQTIFTDRQGPWGLFDWVASGYESQNKSHAAGRIQLDFKGFFFAHSEGKIRLRPGSSIMQRILILVVLIAAGLHFLL
jgi:methionyl-tRNA formyltransferase